MKRDCTIKINWSVYTIKFIVTYGASWKAKDTNTEVIHMIRYQLSLTAYHMSDLRVANTNTIENKSLDA